MADFPDTNIPCGWDRADGGLTTDYGSTPSAGSMGINGVGIDQAKAMTANWGPDLFDSMYIFEEVGDSPTLDFSEQCTITHTYLVDKLTAQDIQTEYQRGMVLEDNASGPFGGNTFRVLSTTAQPVPKTAGFIWRVSVTSEAQSFANPPEEISYATVEFNPAAEKHPRYSALSYYQRNVIRGADVADFIDVAEQFGETINKFSGSNNQWADQKGQALELLFKKQKGEDSFYLSGFKIEYSKYYWEPQPINPGGYIEDPFKVIPYQFWTDANGANIFAYTSTYNQNLYPNPDNTPPTDPPYGLSWLRQTDVQTLNRTWYKVTATWMGAPLGQFDNEWYNPVLQALQTTASMGGQILS